MTVGQLIEKLKRLDSQSIVCVVDDFTEAANNPTEFSESQVYSTSNCEYTDTKKQFKRGNSIVLIDVHKA